MSVPAGIAISLSLMAALACSGSQLAQSDTKLGSAAATTGSPTLCAPLGTAPATPPAATSANAAEPLPWGDSGDFIVPELNAATHGTPPFSPQCSARAAELVAQMTLAEKIGQMVQAERDAVKRGDVQKYFLGSVFSGGDSSPGKGDAAAWANATNELHAAALTTRLKIPLAFASDAVHGHNNIIGATIFPHAIGFGATGDAALVEQAAHITSLEMMATGVDWTFTPMIGAARDLRWGRVLESFSEDPLLAGKLGAAAIRGLQGKTLGAKASTVIATAKHFAGDGNTTFSTADPKGMDAENPVFLDRGDVRLTNSEFVRLALQQYVPVIDSGVGSVMMSFSSLRGQKVLTSRKLVTDLLAEHLKFKGIRLSDYESVRTLSMGAYEDNVVAAVNAGMDVAMEAAFWREFVTALTAAVAKNRVSMARIDDAVTRVLQVKCAAGLWERPPHVDPQLKAVVGSPAHRAVARDAVRRSVVLLQNRNNVLPLQPSAKLHVLGQAANDLTLQCGGWTISWVGAGSKTRGTTLLAALKAANKSNVSYSKDAKAARSAALARAADAVVVAIAEPAYAEWIGDRDDLTLPKADIELLQQARASGKPVVAVLLSGRPLVITSELDLADAWLAAWLPGTEGDGMADVIFGAYAPSGKLSFSWPRNTAQEPINVGDPSYDPLFPVGYGLSYPQVQPQPQLQPQPNK